MTVTADTITPTQIRELRRLERADGNRINAEICSTALGELHGARGQVVDFALSEIEQARAFCAAAWNERSAAGWLGLCEAGRHGLDFEGQACDVCLHESGGPCVPDCRRCAARKRRLDQ